MTVRPDSHRGTVCSSSVRTPFAVEELYSGPNDDAAARMAIEEPTASRMAGNRTRSRGDLAQIERCRYQSAARCRRASLVRSLPSKELGGWWPTSTPTRTSWSTETYGGAGAGGSPTRPGDRAGELDLGRRLTRRSREPSKHPLPPRETNDRPSDDRDARAPGRRDGAGQQRAHGISHPEGQHPDADDPPPNPIVDGQLDVAVRPGDDQQV